MLNKASIPNKLGLFICYICVLVLLIILPINNSASLLNHTYILQLRADYWAHILILFPWMFFKPVKTTGISNRAWLLAGICFAIAVEGIQFFLPYRTFNINDMLGNSAGVLTGCIFYMIRERMLSV